MQKLIMLFILISFVHSKNYCVEKTKGNCKQMCQNQLNGFDMIFDHIPNNNEVPNENITHNIYIADSVDYYNSNHNFIICDPSTKLIYRKSFSLLSIKSNIISAGNENLTINIPKSKKLHLLSNKERIPILFPFTNNLTIDIDLYESNNPVSIILEAREPNLYLKPMFLTGKYEKKLISISNNSEKIRIVEITNEIKNLFGDITKLEEDPKYYYCISDKETKCPDYSTYDLNYINSPSEIENYPAVLIIDSSVPQYYSTRYEYRLNMHIICLEGSSITYMPTWSSYVGGSYYIIIHDDYIELYNGMFEGKGSFTFIQTFDISIHTTTEKNNFDFTIDADYPFSLFSSNIGAYRYYDKTPLTIEPKIKTSELTLLNGPKHLIGLFESTKYIDKEEIILKNVTMETLKEYHYKGHNYHLTNEVHYVPVTWKAPLTFYSESYEKSTLIFNDSYSFGSRFIDNFIFLNDYKEIIINPKRFLHLIYPAYFDDRLTINIENDIIVHGYSGSSKYPDEYTKEYCSITGKGTLKFLNEDQMNTLKVYCSYDEENIHFELFKSDYPNISVCVGQSNLEQCISKIKDINLNEDIDWIWLRNVNSLKIIYKYYKAYVTDDQLINSFENYDWNIILTEGSSITLVSTKITLYKDGIEGIRAQDPSAKLTILNYVQKNTEEPYEQINMEIIYEDAPTDIDLQIYYHNGRSKLIMNYYKNYVPNSIRLKGKGFLYVREPYHSISDIFDNNNDKVAIITNLLPDYTQICYGNEPILHELLNDFVLATNIDELIEYDSVSFQSKIFIFKDVLLPLKSLPFVTNEFICEGQVTITFDLPNQAILIFNSSMIEIIADKTYSFSINQLQTDVKYIFNVDESIILDYISLASELPSIEFRSSKNSTEIIPSPAFKQINDQFQNKFRVQEGITITSPAPDCIKGLFMESQTISSSSKWSYIYLNEEGKTLYEDFTSFPLDDFIDNDNNLAENVVFLLGKKEKMAVPSSWIKIHNVYLLQDNFEFWIEKPKNISYYKDGVLIDNKIKFVSGKININATTSFTINVDLPKGYEIIHYMYDVRIDMSDNTNTNIYEGSIISNQDDEVTSCVKLYGYDNRHKVVIYLNNQNDMYELKPVIYLSQYYGVKYKFTYDNICYCSLKDSDTKCPGNYFHASDFSSLLRVVHDNPDLIINVANDLYIPYEPSENYTLNPFDENIVITLPYIAESITIKENDYIEVKYSESKSIVILKKANIKIMLKDSVTLNVEADTNSIISFILYSDVLIATNKKIESNFQISVTKNSYKFYSENVEMFGNIFGSSLESFNKICAYDGNADSSCTFSKKDLIENVFSDKINYEKIEIALSSNEQEISLPTISKMIRVNILPTSSNSLKINTTDNVIITTNFVLIDDFWQLEGNTQILHIYLNSSSSISIADKLTKPIVFILTSNETIIDLGDCTEQDTPQISFIKQFDGESEIIVYGNSVIFNNFKNAISKHDGISIIRNGTQKYLCICEGQSCDECKENIEGRIETANTINQEPGENYQIRIFDDFEVSSNIFHNEHNVDINYNNQLNLTNVEHVNQNITDGIKVDNLIFINGSNLLLKPKGPILNITMSEGNEGHYFTIELDTFLKLNVVNSNEAKRNSSRLFVTGHGELNLYDYPIDEIRANKSLIRLIKGVYTICNSKSGSYVCSYASAEGYRQLENCYNFREDFDPNSKIVVFLDSFTSSVDVHIHYLKGQKIQFIRKPSSSKLLEGNKQNKLRVLSSNEILCKSDSTTEISGILGEALLDTADSDLFVVGFEGNLTIKQEGPLSTKTNTISVQPMSEESIIHIDDSFDIEKQKLKINTETDEPVTVRVLMNSTKLDEEIINNFIETNKENVKVFVENDISPSQSIEIRPTKVLETSDNLEISQESEKSEIYEQPNSSNSSKKGLSTTAIILIIVGALIAVIAVVITILLIIKKKNQRIQLDIDDDSSESIGI